MNALSDDDVDVTGRAEQEVEIMEIMEIIALPFLAQIREGVVATSRARPRYGMDRKLSSDTLRSVPGTSVNAASWAW